MCKLPFRQAAWASAGAFALMLCSQGAGAQGFKVLYNFKGGSDGSEPFAGVVLDASGNLYGTTRLGGSSGCGGGGCGTVFKAARDGTETVLYAFAGGSDGASPSALMRDSQGNLYGTTVQGGNSCHIQKGGCGTIFKLTPDNQEAILYAFKGRADGGLPYSDLLPDEAGNLYGTTYQGGDLTTCYGGCGTVFEWRAASGRLKTLYTFHEGSDGGFPRGGLIRGSDGNFYGTASGPCGVVFRLTPGGTQTVLHTFAEGDGCNPAAKLYADSRGNLYGTAQHGGYEGNPACGSYFPYGCGVVFRISRAGDFKLLHAFRGRDGDEPVGGVAMDAQGNLYGTTTLAGDADAGTVFELSGSRRTTIHMFEGTDGAYSMGDLIIDSAGNLYGTSAGGGNAGCGCGTVFEITP